jgi:hypothetical protein
VAAIGEFGDQWDEPFGMAASDHLMSEIDDAPILDQRDRAGLAGAVDDERSSLRQCG